MLRRSAVLLALVALVAALPAAASAKPRTASASGVTKLNGKTVFVEVFVKVAKGETARQATNAALAAQGAKRKPPSGGGGTGGPGFTGLVWDRLPVTQFYNGAGARVSGGDAILRATQSTWTGAPGRFSMSYGGTTTRCPSLVRECPGQQVFDGLNDVGWAGLSGRTLAVTWSSSSIDEADMAINSRVTWSTGCTQLGSSYDLQTVVLHENGHVAGLDHASSTQSVMYPSYQTARCSLFPLDQQAIAALYP